MHSFISNFKKRHWLRSWLTTWFLTVLLLMIVLIGYEKFLQSKNYQPSVAANKPLWNWHRNQAQYNDSATALLGASRIQLGLHTATLRGLLPGQTVLPLAINGQYPMATLANLAADDSFNGLIILSFTAQMLEPRYFNMQQEHVKNFMENHQIYTAWDAKVTAEIKAQFRFMHHGLELKHIVNSLFEFGVFPKVSYVFGQADSSAEGHYELTDTAPLRQHFIDDKSKNYQENPPMSELTWMKQIQELNAMINSIRQRGGDVVIIRFPTDGGHWDLDQIYYPKHMYWDVLVSQYPELKTIHFKDDAILSSFKLPDSSHLDVNDAKKFTQRIIELLLEYQFISLRSS